MEDPMLLGLNSNNSEDNGQHLPESKDNDPIMTDPIMSDTLNRTRRLQPKLSSDILLSERGLPYLVKNGPKRLRISTSKNKPYDNLSRIVQFYQLWAHELYPRAKFKDFIKICHSMKNDRIVRDYRMRLCAEEMTVSQSSKLAGGNEEGREEDNDIYQESIIAQGSNEVPDKRESMPGSSTQIEEENASEALDTQELPTEKENEDNLQEDEDAMEVMKELGF